MKFLRHIICVLAVFYMAPVIAEAPALPMGISAPPPLPGGLAPALPSGLDKATSEVDDMNQPKAKYFDKEVYGWLEYRYAERLRNNSDLHGDEYLNELRFHVDSNFNWSDRSLEVAFDLIVDGVDQQSVDLETGEGWFDLRKFSYYQPLGDSADLRIGRQVLTWGTGDLLFLNDLFPKDWHYLLGRDIEYIKTPSDAVKLTFYNDLANLDIIYTPQFEPDGMITGRRMSLYDPRIDALTGTELPINVRNDIFENDELNLRLSRNIDSVELALYGYQGYYHSPSEYDPVNDEFTFSRLSSIGFSVRTPLGPGIFNFEFANWVSEDDRSGTDPWIRNSERRYLLGYEWEAAKELTVGLQYYVEHMQDYNDYKDNLPAGARQLREKRELLTLRMTKFMLAQTLKASVFSYYQPVNGDYYVRPEINYQVNDQLTLETGFTLFGNKDNEINANFGQLEENSHIYFMVRYNFESLF